MRLIVGLGNPGAQYAGNRHNIGWMAVDRIAAEHGFGPFRARFQGHVSEGRIGTERVVLLKPGTFMNLSGQAAGEAMRYLNLAPDAVIAIHDELDLAPGQVRWKLGGGHAGHNGLRSLHQHIGEGYGRLRLGIGHPGHKDRVSGYVLSDFSKAEAAARDAMVEGTAAGIAALLAGDTGAVAAEVAKRLPTTAPAADAGRA